MAISPFSNTSVLPSERKWLLGDIVKMIANPQGTTGGQLTKAVYSAGKTASEQAAKDAVISGKEAIKEKTLAANDAINALRLANAEKELANKEGNLENESLKYDISLEPYSTASTSRNLGILGSVLSGLNYVNQGYNQYTQRKLIEDAISKANLNALSLALNK